MLGRVARVRVSRATLSRVLRRLGWSRKKIAGSGQARRVLEVGLAGFGGRRSQDRRRSAGVRGRDGLEHGALSALRLGSPERAGSREGTAQPRREHDAAGEHEREGMDSCLAVVGSASKAVFEAYVEQVLAPAVALARTCRGDRQPLRPQGREGSRAGGGARVRACVLRRTLWTSTPSKRRSRRSWACCGGPRRGRAKPSSRRWGRRWTR